MYHARLHLAALEKPQTISMDIIKGFEVSKSAGGGEFGRLEHQVNNLYWTMAVNTHNKNHTSVCDRSQFCFVLFFLSSPGFYERS
jgi:hypothetical protein